MYVRSKSINLLKEFLDSHGIPYSFQTDPSGWAYFSTPTEFRSLLHNLIYHYRWAAKEEGWESILPFIFQPIENFLTIMVTCGAPLDKNNKIDLKYCYDTFHKYMDTLKSEEAAR